MKRHEGARGERGAWCRQQKQRGSGLRREGTFWQQSPLAAASGKDSSSATAAIGVDAEDEEEYTIKPEWTLEEDLQDVFYMLCDEKDELLSLEQFLAFDDIAAYISDGLLERKEVEDMWGKLPKAGGEGDDRVDSEGFVDIFMQIEDLFEEGDEDDEASEEALVGEGGKQQQAAAVGGSAAGAAVGGGVGVPSQKKEEDDDDDDSLKTAFQNLLKGEGRTAEAQQYLSLEDVLQWDELKQLVTDMQLSDLEVTKIFERTPKAPGSTDRLDLAGFTALNDEIDDLLEGDDRGIPPLDSVAPVAAAAPAVAGATVETQRKGAAEEEEEGEEEEGQIEDGSGLTMESNGQEEGEGDTDDTAELEEQFVALMGSVEAQMTLQDVLQWEEVSGLLAEGQLEEKEVKDIWDKVSTRGLVNLFGFIAFNDELDALFTYEDEEEDEEDDAQQQQQEQQEEEKKIPKNFSRPAAAVAEPAAEPAAEAAAEAAPVVKGATPLPDMRRPTAGGAGGQSARRAAAFGGSGPSVQESKQLVLDLANAQLASCGIDTDEGSRRGLLSAAERLSQASAEDGNIAASGELDAVENAVVGKWRLLYTSSKSVEYHSGLTGLANTLPNAKFQGFTQLFTKDGSYQDCTYVEELDIVGGRRLDVNVDASWEVKPFTSLLTDRNFLAVSVFPMKVRYGFVKIRGERWKPLRALNLLDCIYMDDDLRVMRGQTALTTIFVFKREQE